LRTRNVQKEETVLGWESTAREKGRGQRLLRRYFKKGEGKEAKKRQTDIMAGYLVLINGEHHNLDLIGTALKVEEGQHCLQERGGLKNSGPHRTTCWVGKVNIWLKSLSEWKCH